MGRQFWESSLFKKPKGEYLKKKSFFFLYYVSKLIDRKSQHEYFKNFQNVWKGGDGIWIWKWQHHNQKFLIGWYFVYATIDWLVIKSGPTLALALAKCLEILVMQCLFQKCSQALIDIDSHLKCSTWKGFTKFLSKKFCVKKNFNKKIWVWKKIVVWKKFLVWKSFGSVNMLV